MSTFKERRRNAVARARGTTDTEYRLARLPPELIRKVWVSMYSPPIRNPTGGQLYPLWRLPVDLTSEIVSWVPTMLAKARYEARVALPRFLHPLGGRYHHRNALWYPSRTTRGTTAGKIYSDSRTGEIMPGQRKSVWVATHMPRWDSLPQYHGPGY